MLCCSLSSIKKNVKGARTETLLVSLLLNRVCGVKNSIARKGTGLAFVKKLVLNPRQNICSDSSPLLFLESKSLMDVMFFLILTEIILFTWHLKKQTQAMLLSIFDHCIGFLAHAILPSKPSFFFHVYVYHFRWIFSVMWHLQQQLFPP